MIHIAGPAHNVVVLQTGVIAEAELEIRNQPTGIGNRDHHLLEILQRILRQPAVQRLARRTPNVFPVHFIAHDGVARQGNDVARETAGLENVNIAWQKGVLKGVARNIQLILAKDVFAIIITEENDISGGIAEFQNQGVLPFRLISKAFPLQTSHRAACGLVIETEIAASAD